MQFGTAGAAASNTSNAANDATRIDELNEGQSKINFGASGASAYRTHDQSPNSSLPANECVNSGVLNLSNAVGNSLDSASRDFWLSSLTIGNAQENNGDYDRDEIVVPNLFPGPNDDHDLTWEDLVGVVGSFEQNNTFGSK